MPIERKLLAITHCNSEHAGLSQVLPVPKYLNLGPGPLVEAATHTDHCAC